MVVQTLQSRTQTPTASRYFLEMAMEAFRAKWCILSVSVRNRLPLVTLTTTESRILWSLTHLTSTSPYCLATAMVHSKEGRIFLLVGSLSQWGGGISILME